MPFIPLLVSFSGKAELKTLLQVEVDGLACNLSGKTILSGFYLNEVLLKLLPLHESCPKIYCSYQTTLFALANADEQPESALRVFEKNLVANLGYGLELNRTATNEPILSHERYCFAFGSGFKRVGLDEIGSFSGRTILALDHENLVGEVELAEAKRLLRLVMTKILGNKKLKTRELLLELHALTKAKN